MKFNFNYRVSAFLVLSVSPLWGAEVSRVQYLMGTLCEIRAFGSDESKLSQAVTTAFEEISRLEKILSTYRQESEVSRVNKLAALSRQSCSTDFLEILLLSRHYAAVTGGAFDATVGPLIRLWDIQGHGAIPKDAAIEQALSVVGYPWLRLDKDAGTVQFGKQGMELDFGGIGKGYALDKATDILKKHKIKSALLNFGGNILAVGAPPKEKAWAIHVGDPRQPDKALFRLGISDASVSTSSQMERAKSIKGKRIGHILDPRSGGPVDFEGSVTVIAPTATEADAFSTALLVMGPEKGLAFMREQKQGAVFYLVPSKDRGWDLRASPRCAFYGLASEKTILTRRRK